MSRSYHSLAGLLGLICLFGLAHAQHEGHGSNPDSGSDSGSGSHSMVMVFFNAIDTPLFVSAWTPKTKGQYAGTCIFLVVLTVIYRALTVGKHLFEHIKAHKYKAQVFLEDSDPENRAASAGPIPASPRFTPRSPALAAFADSGPHILPWRHSVDLNRALMTFVITGVSYLLMLAVMTMNVGYFMSVLAGAFLGEVLLGRFGGTVDHH